MQINYHKSVPLICNFNFGKYSEPFFAIPCWKCQTIVLFAQKYYCLKFSYNVNKHETVPPCFAYFPL